MLTFFIYISVGESFLVMEKDQLLIQLFTLFENIMVML